MKKNVPLFAKKSIHNFFEATLNLFLFFPYFFSVSTLFKTFFHPWKNIITKKTVRGFSFSELMGRIFFNLVSRLIGAFMRLSIILFYMLFQSLYVIFLPFIIGVYFLLLPFLICIYILEKTEEEKKASFKAVFIASRMLKQENYQAVENWFEMYYQKYLHKKAWWKLSNLLTIPPLARDWAVGYTPLLDEFSQDLTNDTYQAQMKSVIGRSKEIHTIVDALAKKIYEGQTNSVLAYKRILKLNLEKILTVYTDTEQRENFLEDLFLEAATAKNTILLIENFDKYVSFGQGRIDLSTSFEKYGKTSTIQFIGITSPFFYQRFIFGNDKVNRLFTRIDVQEISLQEAKLTLLEAAHLFEEKNKAIIPYETIIETIDKSEFYITYIPFPEKAFNLLDMACAYVKNTNSQTVTPNIINIVLSEKTHIPTSLTGEMKKKLITLEQLLGSRVIYQTEAVQKLAGAMRRSFILLGKRRKPLASFLFLGPTGVGKTETAKALADIFFGSNKFLLRFDMSLYQTTADIKTLIGSIESSMPGLLSNAIRENPYAVLLLDEIEKADKDLLNIFLTLVDEGYFTDGFGKKVDCKNLIIIATSNAGADYIYKKQTSLIASVKESDLIDYLVSQHLFSPEFLNRFDGVVTYRPVTEQSIFTLASKMIDTIKETIYKLYKIHITVTDETLKSVVAKGYNPAFGARNLERVITQELEDKIAKLILEEKAKEGDTISL